MTDSGEAFSASPSVRTRFSRVGLTTRDGTLRFSAYDKKKMAYKKRVKMRFTNQGWSVDKANDAYSLGDGLLLGYSTTELAMKFRVKTRFWRLNKGGFKSLVSIVTV